uniref:Uncharacterized protein n=1 Tax=Arundo donax TaxID=35708 RepID=A0A0A9CG74_ARUDO
MPVIIGLTEIYVTAIWSFRDSSVSLTASVLAIVSRDVFAAVILFSAAKDLQSNVLSKRGFTVVVLAFYAKDALVRIDERPRALVFRFLCIAEENSFVAIIINKHVCLILLLLVTNNIIIY